MSAKSGGSLRHRFHIPRDPATGVEKAYFTGNSLGLQPKGVEARVREELEAWARWGVDGHFEAKHPWFSYHENLTEPMARIVGALPSETVVMNTLTVNLHLMLVSFYRPTRERFKILVEKGAFPSDQYAVASQASFHGYSPVEAIVEVSPRPGEDCLRVVDLLEVIERRGRELALVLLGNVNYRTGQALPMRALSDAARAQGARVGWDLAHGAGNLPLALHDSGVDFAVWCSYKYLNSGPGSLGGCFVHERHARDATLPRFAGWWGHDKASRFRMEPHFRPIAGAEGWQLSNPPILPMAAMAASLEVFDEAGGMERLVPRGRALVARLEEGLRRNLAPGSYEILTPSNPEERGCQLSIRMKRGPLQGRDWVKVLGDQGIVVDFREPDILRAAPVPLYVEEADVDRLVSALAMETGRADACR